MLTIQLSNRDQLDVVVSDLTYVRVDGKWNYVCILLDLFNREIIGYSAGAKKDAQLVYKAFTTVKYKLDDINIFHTDRVNEFKNNIIDGLIDTFNIKRSLSKKGCPYANYIILSSACITACSSSCHKFSISFLVANGKSLASASPI